MKIFGVAKSWHAFAMFSSQSTCSQAFFLPAASKTWTGGSGVALNSWIKTSFTSFPHWCPKGKCLFSRLLKQTLFLMLLSDVHVGLSVPKSCSSHVVKGTYEYFHYKCDGQNDVGWGCGYRTLQTICSWMKLNCECESKISQIPTIEDIQEILVNIGDKPRSFLRSREWIGSFEICLLLDHLYDISSKIIHVRSGRDVSSKFDELLKHFQTFGSPVMIGGDTDASSKALLGIATDGSKQYFLILDPHFSGNADTKYLQENGWIAWKDEQLFLAESFYNFCLPQCRSNEKKFM